MNTNYQLRDILVFSVGALPCGDKHDESDENYDDIACENDGLRGDGNASHRPGLALP